MDILKIKRFLDTGNGNSYGNGYGYGDGNGDGYGYGDGYGNGYGYGDGDGNGNGDGDGYGNGNGYANGNGDGDGDGYGNGNSYGNGYGDGYGYGNGDGYGYGNGNGYGYGDGDGYGGIKSINGYDIYNVDAIPTIFTHIHGNIAKGYILERRVYLTPCYIVKGNGYLAHGETLKSAQEALEGKIICNMDVDERISEFKVVFPDINQKYAAELFYKWHHNLTGSCEIGRKAFASDHNINIGTDTMTVKEFIELTENAFCGEVIRKLKESYEEI